MRSAILLITGLCSLSCIMAQVPGLGPCPQVSTKENFEATKYLGKWFEMERYFAIFELGGKCVSATYGAGENGTITVLNKQINSLTGSKSNITGVARPDPNNPAKLSVRFPGSPVDGPYWVVDTDYENFTVVWSCTNLGLFNTKFAWILTRKQQPPVEVMQKAYKVVDTNNISRAFFMRTNQQNCPEGY